MCGILNYKLKYNDKFIKLRGQDAIGTYKRGKINFKHYLLSITGETTTQPYIQDDVVMLYNGEIYNHKFVKSDGENIIPLYLKHGIKFTNHLDGEYAIAIYDFKNDIALFITDPFATKPIWRNGIECASYESGVGGHKIPANTIEAVQISTEKDLFTFKHHEWNFEQHKDTYDDCTKAFIKAVEKRYKPKCFIGLSSGYDSGAIACALRGKDFKCYSIVASENLDVIKARQKILGNVEIIKDFDINTQKKHLRNNAEEFKYNIEYDEYTDTSSYKEDYASIALSHICSLAKKENRKVYLSGAGADEILSDYSLIKKQSQFKGLFPDKLEEWKNFTGSCMYSYLGKEECVGGSWNVETRYPFLDKEFVQEFLWLKPELKNRNYKAPIYEYLTSKGFPFELNRKIGFK